MQIRITSEQDARNVATVSLYSKQYNNAVVFFQFMMMELLLGEKKKKKGFPPLLLNKLSIQAAT